MYRCLKTDFQTDRINLDKLFDANRNSALVWNRCLELANSYRHEHDGSWISKTQLQTLTKQTVPLHSQSIQAIVASYCEARDATKAARDKGLTNKYPWRNKHHFPTVWHSPKGFTLNVETGILILKFCKALKNCPAVVKLPQSTIDRLQGKNLKEVSLIWDNRLMLSICFDDDNPKPEKVQTCNEAAIDLGIIHSITAFSKNGQAVIITGRLLRAVNRYRSKKLIEFTKKMFMCTKKSNRWYKLRRAMRKMLSKTAAQIRDITHKITRRFVDFAVANNVDKVFVGNVEGVQRNTKSGSKKKRKNRKVRQQLSQWNFGQQLEYLKYKLEAVGIRLIKISEAYSTQTCPMCGKRHKAHNRNYRCTCGYTAHRDVHGARNILSLGLYNRIQYVSDVQDITYLRIA